MSINDRSRAESGPSSLPPDGSSIEASWDDDTLPGLDLDDPLNEFDRVTAIPELPSALYVQRVMASAEDGVDAERPTEPSLLAAEAIENMSSLPPAKVYDESGPDSLSGAPTTRPAALGAATGDRDWSSATDTGLVDLTFDSISSLKVAPARAPTLARPERDPELDQATARPPAYASNEPPEGRALLEMKDRYAMGDFSGALVLAEGILQSNPADLEAPRYAERCRDVLTQMYAGRLGSLEQFVRVAVPGDQIRWLTLDHRAGFLLSLIDGGSTLDQILDMSGMPRLDALRIMYQLLDQRVIALSS
jgi:hypothetical protein